MTNDIEAVARALLAAIDRTMFGPGQAVAPYVESLRSALAHATRGEGEPVAWVALAPGGAHATYHESREAGLRCWPLAEVVPLYARPATTTSADTVADIYRFLAQQFAVMDTGDLADLVDGDRTNPIDVLRGVREALRLYGTIPLRKAAAIPTPPPATGKAGARRAR